MDTNVRLYKSEDPMSRDDVAAYLEQLATKVGRGQVILVQLERELALQLPEDLVLGIEAEEEGTGRGIAHRLGIEIMWVDSHSDAHPAH